MYVYTIIKMLASGLNFISPTFSFYLAFIKFIQTEYSMPTTIACSDLLQK